MTETPTVESDSTDDELPIDTDRVPDRWDVSADPTGTDTEAVELHYGEDRGETAEPAASILLHTPETSKTAQSPEDGYGVEVQDTNAGDVARDHLNPLAESEEHDSFDDALERLYELAEQYPLEETRA